MTAKEAMAHKWFDPVREDVEKELKERQLVGLCVLFDG